MSSFQGNASAPAFRKRAFRTRKAGCDKNEEENLILVNQGLVKSGRAATPPDNEGLFHRGDVISNRFNILVSHFGGDHVHHVLPVVATGTGFEISQTFNQIIGVLRM